MFLIVWLTSLVNMVKMTNINLEMSPIVTVIALWCLIYNFFFINHIRTVGQNSVPYFHTEYYFDI